ncbi:MAG TPA: glycosyltransferase family 39 protein, partial [Terriglobales bacterium]|nr:glycosyltransferase family 39 protein [Terriglobales bacterium]
IAGTAFCWFLYRWIALVFGRTAAWVGLIFCSFLPPLIALSSEVRQYGLLLCLLGAALYLVERALAAKSPVEMLLAYVCVWLAVWTHYSALLFAAGLGAYLFFRLMEDGFPGSVKIAWGASQIVLLALFDFLYRTHLERLNAGQAITSQPWLANSVFHPERQSFFVFVLGRSFGVFQFVFGQLAVGDVAGVLFLLGVVSLIRRPAQFMPSERDSKMHARWIALLLALPFALNCGAALLGAYPYGGTRHSAFLIPFAFAGVGLGLAWLLKRDGMRAVAATLAIAIVSAAFGKPHRPFMTRVDQSSENMSRAMTSLERQVRADGVILVDYQTSLLFARYLCGSEAVSYDRSLPGFLIFRCAGFRVLSTGPETPVFTARAFLHDQLWEVLESPMGLKPGDRIWVVQAGWDIRLGDELRTTRPEFRDLKVESFGRNIEMFEVEVGSAGPVMESLSR